MYLPYIIYLTYSSYYTNLVYFKKIYVKYAIITLLLLEPSTTFHCDIWSCDFLTVTCAIILTSNPKFKDKKINRNKNKNKKWNENN